MGHRRDLAGVAHGTILDPHGGALAIFEILLGMARKERETDTEREREKEDNSSNKVRVSSKGPLFLTHNLGMLPKRWELVWPTGC